MRFVAVGDVMVDVVCSGLPSPAERLHADVSLRAGGSAVNAATAAAAAGASASVVGRIGTDSAGDLVTAELRARGIHVHLARDDRLPTGVTVALAQERSGVSVVASRGANERLSREDLPEPLDADALFVSGFALFQPGSADAARAALDRFTGTWAGLDAASPSLASAVLDLPDLPGGRRKVVFATAEEARAITGLGPEESARKLASRFTVACVKLGGDEGALAASGSELERRVAKPVARTSSFGAGDAFGAVFLVALTAKRPLGRALELACDAGARAASCS